MPPNNDKAGPAALRRRMIEEGFIKPSIADIVQLVRPETPAFVLDLVKQAEAQMQATPSRTPVLST